MGLKFKSKLLTLWAPPQTQLHSPPGFWSRNYRQKTKFSYGWTDPLTIKPPEGHLPWFKECLIIIISEVKTPRMNKTKRIYPQICQHVTVDCDSSMLSMENITWGWRGVQQRMAQGKAVVVDSDWLIWLVRWLKGLWTVELSQITWWGFAAITSGGSIRKYGSLTGFSFWWTLDRTPTPNPTLTDPAIAHTHAHRQTCFHTHEQTDTRTQAHIYHILHRHTNNTGLLTCTHWWHGTRLTRTLIHAPALSQTRTRSPPSDLRCVTVMMQSVVEGEE